MIQMEELYEKILAELDLSKEVEDDELVEIIHRTLEEKGKESYIPLKEKSGLGKELFNTFRKLDILQELIEDDEITEIMINGTDHIFVEKQGKILELEKRFITRTKLEDVIQQIVAGSNRIVNEASPIVDARLPDGSRVNVVLYPVALNGDSKISEREYHNGAACTVGGSRAGACAIFKAADGSKIQYFYQRWNRFWENHFFKCIIGLHPKR